MVKSYFAFMHNKGLGSAGIRMRSRGWANHVALLRCEESELMTTLLYEAIAGDMKPVRWAKSLWGKVGGLLGKDGWGQQKPRGFVHIRNLATALEDKNEIRVFELPPTLPHLEEAAWQWVVAHEGVDYDYPGLVGFVPVPMPSSWKTQSKREAQERLFCSEAGTIWAHLRAGVQREPTGAYSVEYPPALVLQPWVAPCFVDPESLMWPGALKEVTWLRPEL